MPLLGDVPSISVKPVREIVYEHLRQAIVSGELAPGVRFTDSQVADEFNISRTPVREAIQKLESEGLIDRAPMKGNVVKEILPEEIAHIFAIRKALETLALRYTAKRITEPELDSYGQELAKIQHLFDSMQDEGALIKAFFPHVYECNRIMFEACQSPRLLALIWQHRELLDRNRVLRVTVKRRFRRSFEIRKELLNLFKERNAEKAASLWGEHLDYSFTLWFENSQQASQLDRAEYM